MTDVKQPELEQAVEREYPLPHSTGVARVIHMHGRDTGAKSTGASVMLRPHRAVPAVGMSTTTGASQAECIPVSSPEPRVTLKGDAK